jgi:hypothetical protein
MLGVSEVPFKAFSTLRPGPARRSPPRMQLSMRLLWPFPVVTGFRGVAFFSSRLGRSHQTCLTADFYFSHGELSAEQAKLLVRNASLTVEDWYFNRAIFNINVALSNDAAELNPVRTREFWLKSAYKKLETWRRLTNGAGPSSFSRRRLLRYPRAPDVRMMLKLTHADDAELQGIYVRLLAHYRANYDALERLTHSKTHADRARALGRARANHLVTEPTLEAIRSTVGGLASLPPVPRLPKRAAACEPRSLRAHRKPNSATWT